MVNAGPLAIAKTFLGEYEKYDPVHILKLRETLKEFLKVCVWFDVMMMLDVCYYWWCEVVGCIRYLALSVVFIHHLYI